MKINERDALKTWGVFMDEKALNNLWLPPHNKPNVSNKSRLEDGVRVVNSKLYIDEREVIIGFNIQAKTRGEFKSKMKEFVTELNKGLVKLEVENEIYKLYTIDFIGLEFIDNIGSLSVRFQEPNPNDRD